VAAPSSAKAASREPVIGLGEVDVLVAVGLASAALASPASREPVVALGPADASPASREPVVALGAVDAAPASPEFSPVVEFGIPEPPTSACELIGGGPLPPHASAAQALRRSGAKRENFMEATKQSP